MPEPDDQKGARRALVVLLAVVFVNIAGFGVVIPLLPFYGRAFHASAFQIGVMFSAFAWVSSSPRRSGAGCRTASAAGPCCIMTIIGTALAYAALAFAPNMAWRPASCGWAAA